MSKTVRPTLLALIVFTAVSMISLVPTRLVHAQSTNVCYDLLEPIWNPPTYTDVVECIDFSFPLSLLMPWCSLPSCRLHPECTISRSVLHPGSWGTTSCEVLPPEKILELFLRGQLRHLDDAVLPGVQGIAYTHMVVLKSAAKPVPPAVQLLFEQLLAAPIGAGMPSFTMEHVQRARLLPRGIATASLYLRPNFDAITLDDLIIINDSDYAILVGTPIPANASLSSMRPGGSLSPTFTDSFALLAHELVHVRQYDELGTDAFLNNYLLETLVKGYGSDSFEREAYAYGTAVKNQLSRNPPIVPSITPTCSPLRALRPCLQICQTLRCQCMNAGEAMAVCADRANRCLQSACSGFP